MKSAQEEQKLRKALAGSTTTMSYHTRALADLQLEQGQSGRFTDKATVVGSKAAVVYPRLPENNPWNSDISGVEPPLGIDLGYVEPCGTPAEVESSLLAASSALSPEDPAVATAGETAPQALAPDCDSPLGSGAPTLIRGRRL